MMSALLLANLLLVNGKIWTGDTPNRFVQAVTISGNRVVAAGTNAEAEAAAAPGARRINLGGRLVVPGFIDNHVHFIEGGLQLSRVQLRDAATPAEFARRIGDFARRSGKGRWVLGGEWDEQLWTPYQLPSRQMIDALTPDNPVFVTRLDIHMGLANSAALKLAGITRNSVAPAGGEIVRDADGEPTGILKDAAMDALYAVIPPPTVEERAAAARAALAHAAKLGVTSVGDVSGSEALEDFRAYQRLDRAGELSSRIHLFAPGSLYSRLTAAGIERGFGSARLQIAGIKSFVDGSLGSSTAAFREPFEGEPENRGLLMQEFADGTGRKRITEADAAGLQVATHAIGDRANDQLLTIYESLPRFRERRLRIEHAQHLGPDLIKRIAAGKIVASMQPYHAIDDGRWASKKIGERVRWAYPFRSLLDAGAVLTFGSDWTVAPLDPLAGIYAAVTRRTTDGRNPNGWVPEEKITVEEALRCYTVNNAWAIFREHELGRIAPGYLADLAVLSADIFSVPAAEIERVRVEMTVFDGRVVADRQ